MALKKEDDLKETGTKTKESTGNLLPDYSPVNPTGTDNPSGLSNAAFYTFLYDCFNESTLDKTFGPKPVET